MPVIRQITAEGAPARVRYAQVPIQDFSNLYRVGQHLGQFGEVLGKIARDLKNNKNEIEISSMLGKIDGEEKAIRLALRTEQIQDEEGVGSYRTWDDPAERTKEYTKRMRDAVKEIGGTASNREVSAKFGSYVARRFPERQVDVFHEAMEDQIKTQQAKMLELQGTYANLSAQAPNPVERNDWIDKYKELLDKAEVNRVLDPVQSQQMFKNFRAKAQYQWMDTLRLRKDYDTLEKENAKGSFDEVDAYSREAVLARAENEKVAQLNRGQTALDATMRKYREGVTRYLATEINNRRATEELIEEYRDHLTDTEIFAFKKRIDEQRRGVGTGNPEVERMFTPLINQPDQSLGSLRELYRMLTAAYNTGDVGGEKYEPWSQQIQNEINRKSTEDRVARESKDNSLRQLQEARGRHTMTNASEAFKTTNGIFEKFDTIASEAYSLFREEFGRRVNYLNGGQGEDAFVLERELMPKYIAFVNSRATARQNVLMQELGKYQDKAKLEAARSTMSPIEFQEKYVKLKELHMIRSRLIELKGIRDILKQGGSSQPGPEKGSRYE